MLRLRLTDAAFRSVCPTSLSAERCSSSRVNGGIREGSIQGASQDQLGAGGGSSTRASLSPSNTFDRWNSVEPSRRVRAGPIGLRQGGARIRFATVQNIHGTFIAAESIALLIAWRLGEEKFENPLTKLSNRTLFADRVNHALENARRHRHIISVAFFDLDGFQDRDDSL